jgi:hypothetical protein
MRNNYWSCSSVSKFIRDWCGAPKKPEAASTDGWDAWEEDFKSNHKVVYWFTEEFLNTLQDVICWPIDKLRDIQMYIINRFVDKIHYLPTRLPPGKYYEIDDRVLRGMFETLVDFVECEKAHMELICSPKDNKAPWWYNFRGTRWKHIRSRELGMKYLNWEMALDQGEHDENYFNGSEQAGQAREVVALYTWWKDVRPNRPNVHEASGWHDICNKRDIFSNKERTEEEELAITNSLNKLHQLEQMYNDEDEQMMIRLVKILKGLWT